MKKALVLSLMLLFVSGLALAKPMSFRLGGGIDLPMDDGVSTGFHGMGGIDYSINPNMSILGNLSYHSIPFDDMGITGVDIDPFSIIGINGEVKYALGPEAPTRFYLLGGLGFASVKSPDMTISVMGYSTTVEGESSTEFMLSLGGGVAFGTVFVEGRYLNIDELDMITGSVGVNL